MGSPKNAKEFREVMDRVFEMMSTDPEMGPKLREAETPQRFEFPDLDLVVNITSREAEEDGQNLIWKWSDDVDWDPDVKMTMDSDVANKYFQGKENVAMAIARRRIKTSGNVKKALALIPITKPVESMYRDMIQSEYPHLVA
jgi:putative sterol carrier protein